MKFYKGQYGPILSEDSYYQALRQLLFAAPDGLCASEHSSEFTEQQIRGRLLNLSARDLISAVYTAATLNRSDPKFAESWFLTLTSGYEARSEIEKMASACEQCKEEFNKLSESGSGINRKFGYQTKTSGRWELGHKPNGDGDHDKRFNEFAKRVKAAGLVKPV